MTATRDITSQLAVVPWQDIGHHAVLSIQLQKRRMLVHYKPDILFVVWFWWSSRVNKHIPVKICLNRGKGMKCKDGRIPLEKVQTLWNSPVTEIKMRDTSISYDCFLFSNVMISELRSRVFNNTLHEYHSKDKWVAYLCCVDDYCPSRYGYSTAFKGSAVRDSRRPRMVRPVTSYIWIV